MIYLELLVRSINKLNMKNKNIKLNFLIAAGGTGGHLFPAMAVGEQLEKLTDNNINLFYIGTENRMESRIIPEKGYKYFSMPIHGFAGISLKSLKLPLSILKSVSIAKNIIKENNIDAVIVAGAYISYPPGLAAFKLKVPLFLMESNVNLGKSNKALSYKATKIFTSYKETEKYIHEDLKSNIYQFGNPLRESISQFPDKNEAVKKFYLDINKKTVLIMGGSLGAKSINIAIENNLGYISKSNWQFIWQTGKNYTIKSSLPANVYSCQFIEDMSSAYSAADLIISRSGATASAEICLVGKPSILIPLSSASNNEQYYNGKVIADNGGAFLIEDNKLGTDLIKKLDLLISDEKLRLKFSENAKKLANPNAASDIAKEILNTI